MRAAYLLASALLVLTCSSSARAAWVGAWGGEENGVWSLDASDNTAAGRDCTRETTTVKTGSGAITCTNTVGNTEAQETDSSLKFTDLDGDGAEAAYVELSCCSWVRTTANFWNRELYEYEVTGGSGALTRVRAGSGSIYATTNSTSNTYTSACAISNNTWMRLCVQIDNNAGTGSDTLKIWCDEIPDASPALDVTMSGGFTTDGGAVEIDVKATYLTDQATQIHDDLVCVNELVSANATRAGQLYYAEVRGLAPDTAKLTPTVSLTVQQNGSCANCDADADVAQCTGSDTSGDCDRAANCLGGGGSACTEGQQTTAAHAVEMGAANDAWLTGYPAHDSGIDSHDIYAVGCRYLSTNNNTADNNYLRMSTDSGCHSNSTCTPVGAGASGADQTWDLDAAATWERLTWWMESDPDNAGSWTTTKLDNIACGSFKHTGTGTNRTEAHGVVIVSSTPYSAGGRRDYWIDVSRRRRDATEGVLWSALASARRATRGGFSAWF